MRPTHCLLCGVTLRRGAISCHSCGLLLLIDGRYVLRDFVGQGGFGSVFKAQDRVTGNLCAVKRVPYESREHYEQVRREISILQNYNLSFVPYFYGAYRFGDSVYIVQEYIDGRTLNSFPRSFWHADRVERMVHIMLRYLHQLHQRGIIHRDLSPSNIMRVNSDPATYVLLDFGIAKEGTSTLTAMQQAGHPVFASPEQVLGVGTTPASDLYSLGATAYSLLTGDVPRPADRLAGARGPRLPSQLVSGVSPILDEVLPWLLELEPADRPRSAAEVLDRIDEYYRPARPRRTRPLSVGFTVAGLLAALVFLALFFARPPGEERAGDPGRIVFPSARSGTYELYLADGPTAAPTLLIALPGDEFAPAWSPDGREIAFVRLLDGDYDIYAVGVDGSALRPVAASTKTEATPAWSPSGDRIIFSSNHTGDYELYSVAANGVGGWTQLTARPGTDRSPIWMSDGRIIFVAQSGNMWGLYSLAPDTAAITPVFSVQREVRTPALAPDETRLAFGMLDEQGNCDIYTVAIDGSDLRQLTSDPAEETYPSWSPDGTQLLFQRKRDMAGVDSPAQIYLVGADGSGLTLISRESPDDRQPAWRRSDP